MEGLFLSQLEGGATELDLGRKWLGDAGAAALATALRSGAGAELTTLRLSANDIGPQGALALADALAAHGGALTALDLTDNRIGATGAAAIARALETNSVLAVVDLSKNRCWNAGAVAVGRAMVAVEPVDELRQITEPPPPHVEEERHHLVAWEALGHREHAGVEEEAEGVGAAR